MDALSRSTSNRLLGPLAIALAAVTTLVQPAPAGAAGPTARPGFPIVLAAPRSFAAAVASVEKATGFKSLPLKIGGKEVRAAEGRAFNLDGKVATRLLDGSHATFLKAGFYLFRFERSFGMGDADDHVAVLATTDAAAVIRRVGTRSDATKVTTGQIVEWLAALQKEEPFYLNEIGEDYVAGTFKVSPQDPAAVARRCAAFAPELTKGSGNAIDVLAEEIKVNRTLYLIW